MRKVLRALAAGQGVAMLIDQHMHSPDAIYVDFFERPAATTSMLAALALRTGAPVLPVFALPLPGGRYRLIYEHPVPPPDPDSPDAIREFTQRCTDVLEMYVRRYPVALALDAPALARRAVARIHAGDVPARTARHRSRRVSDVPSRAVVLAPNWLGDVVMALPAIASFRALWPTAHLSVAARASVAPLLSLVDGVDDVVMLEGRGGRIGVLSGGPDRDTLANGRFDVAVLLPNSFHAALLARRAGISERWGYRADVRSRMLTRALPNRSGFTHQAEYDLQLVRGLGGLRASMVAELQPTEEDRQRAVALLRELGWDGTPIVAFAPGAAFGLAKRWPPDRMAAAIR